MFIDLTPEQARLRDTLRVYFDGLLSPADRVELLTERHGAVYRDVVRRMGRGSWLGVGWPERYGGRGFGQVEQQIFADEAARADVPLPAVTLQTVGPTLQEHGTPHPAHQIAVDGAVPLGEQRDTLGGRHQLGEVGAQLVAQRELVRSQVEEHACRSSRYSAPPRNRTRSLTRAENPCKG